MKYLKSNPFDIINIAAFKISEDQRKRDVHQRILNQEEWQAFINTLLSMPENNYQQRFEKARLRFIVTTLFFLGLRVEEVTNLKWSHFYKIDNKWLVQVAGKGRAGQSDADGVLCSNAYLKEVALYRTFFGLHAEPHGEDVFAVYSQTKGKKLSTTRIRTLIKNIAKQAAKCFEDDSISAKRLLAMSPHWIRHLCASTLSQHDIDIRHIKTHLRHKNSATTHLYIHSDLNDRIEEINKIKLFEKA